MTDVRVITPDDLDNTTVFLNSEHKVQAMATAIRPNEMVNVLDLNWTAYPHQTGVSWAEWSFTNKYTKPFLSQMHTADVGLEVKSPVVYFFNLQDEKVTLVAYNAALNVIRSDGRKFFVKVEESDVSKLQNNTAGITPDIINQYITQNLEVVEQISNFHDGWGNYIDSPFGIRIAGQQHRIDRVGRIKGTNWLVFGSSTMT